MDSKKVIVCDLDGTLAISKSPLSPAMAEVLRHILRRRMLAVVSGGSFQQFEKQFIAPLQGNSEALQNLFLFPTIGSTCYVYNVKSKKWDQVYNEPLAKKEKDQITKALKEVIDELDVDVKGSRSDLIEDRGSQITFSALGQDAPIEEKKVWDPDQKKRTKMLEALKAKIPDFEPHIGGTTSIDITKKGLDKAYAIGKIKKLLNVTDDEILFFGDALYKGGNDEAIKTTGVDFVQPDGPADTLELLSRYM